MSYANSKIPSSAQQDVHQDLHDKVRKHGVEPFKKPFAAYNVRAFHDSLQPWDKKAPLILDAGCGVGLSTIELARTFPEHWVIGVDQSEERLARKKPYPVAWMPQNLIFVRADLVDYWRLLHQEGIQVDRHYVLYPNPWPKIGHLGRRWPAHPVFPYLLSAGGILECRTNWHVYAQEFAAAIEVLAQRSVAIENFEVQRPLTAFERKYHDSGQALYRIIADLNYRFLPPVAGESPHD